MSRIVLFLYLLFSFEVKSQNCLPDQLQFTRQGQVDSFAIVYPGCTDINGEFTIFSPAIKNLQGLSHIKTISGRFIVLATDIVDFSAFLSLEKIAQIEILNNSKLQSLDGINVDSIDYLHLTTTSETNLEALTSVKYVRTLTVEGMELQDLNVFSNLEDFEFFKLIYVPSLPDLTGFPQISSAFHDRTIEITGCISLQSLAGIETAGITTLTLRTNQQLIDLSKVNEMSDLVSFNANNNQHLTNISLQNLTKLKNINLVNNNNLTNLWGPEFISAMESITMINNEKLDTVNGFRNVNTVERIELRQLPWTNLDMFESLDSVYGDLKLDENLKLISIAGLEGLRYVGGILGISLTNLNDLQGLDSLAFAGDLAIYTNDNLVSLSALKSLTSIGSIQLLSLPKLQNLEGLGSLTHIGSFITLFDLASLENLEGLPTLDTIHGDLDIERIPLLKDINVFQDVQYIDGSFWLFSNASLESIPQFENLTDIKGHLYISNNDKLLTLNGFQNLKDLHDGVLAITENDLLPSLDGLDSIPWHKISIVLISENPSLSICVTPTICQYLAHEEKTRIIMDNAPGCQSDDEILALCGPLSTQDLLGDQVSIFPNPTNGVFNISTDYTIQKINVMDVYGTALSQVNGNASEIDVTSLPTGFYFVQICLDEGIVVKRLIKN